MMDKGVVDRTNPKPIYQQITDWIYQQIVSGAWPAHFKLKSEVDLANELGVSRGTVRKAVRELIDEGLLISIHGRGTFVASDILEQPLADHLITVSEDLISRGIAFETEVVAQNVIPPSDRIASLLSLPAGVKVFFTQRIRRIARVPVILLFNYVVCEECPGIETVDLTKYRLFETLEDTYGLALDWGQRTFAAQVADEAVARYLEIAPGDPVLYLNQLVYLDDGSPIELSDVWFRGDRFRLSATLQRDALRTAGTSIGQQS